MARTQASLDAEEIIRLAHADQLQAADRLLGEARERLGSQPSEADRAAIGAAVMVLRTRIDVMERGRVAMAQHREKVRREEERELAEAALERLREACRARDPDADMSEHRLGFTVLAQQAAQRDGGQVEAAVFLLLARQAKP